MEDEKKDHFLLILRVIEVACIVITTIAMLIR